MLWLGQAVEVPGSFARPPTTDTILTPRQARPGDAVRGAAHRLRRPPRQARLLPCRPRGAHGHRPWLRRVARERRPGERIPTPARRSRPHSSKKPRRSARGCRHVVSRDIVVPHARHLGRSLRAVRDAAAGRLLRLRAEPPPRAALGSPRSHHGRRRSRESSACVALIVWGAPHAPGPPLVHALVEGDRARDSKRSACPRGRTRCGRCCPSRNDALGLVLPVDAAWERWGRQAVVVRVRDDAQGQRARGAPRSRSVPATRRTRRVPAARRLGLARSRRGARGPRLGRTRRNPRRARAAAGGLAPRVGAQRRATCSTWSRRRRCAAIPSRSAGASRRRASSGTASGSSRASSPRRAPGAGWS